MWVGYAGTENIVYWFVVKELYKMSLNLLISYDKNILKFIIYSGSAAILKSSV